MLLQILYVAKFESNVATEDAYIAIFVRHNIWVICSNIRPSQHVAYVATTDSFVATFVAYVATSNISKSTFPHNHYLKVYVVTDDNM